MDTTVIVIIVIIVIAFIAIAAIWGTRAHQRKVTVGREELVGRTAEVKTLLNPKGTVLVEGELWAAVTDGEAINPDEQVIITKVEGLKLWVKKA